MYITFQVCRDRMQRHVPGNGAERNPWLTLEIEFGVVGDCKTGPKIRRSRTELKSAVAAATNRRDKAQAHYQFALFHDNNSREADAIPHYEAALRLGLFGEQKAQAVAWLASSLYKTGLPDEALRRIKQAQGATSDQNLLHFLDGLARRILRSRR